MSIPAYVIAVCIGATLAKWLPGTYLFTALLGILISTLTAKKLSGRPSRDVYELDHAVLNIRPPKTMWLNMGYWKDTKSFPEACEALARRLGVHSGIQAGESILDLGCGCGESVIFWATQFNASKVTGVTAVPSHIAHAKRALAASEDIPLDTKIDLQVGDAIAYTRQAANRGEKYDRVIALDCAYHFNTRPDFLKQAEAVLEFTGTIGLTDLMLPNEPLSLPSSCLMRIICYFANVPFENLITQAEYEQVFKELNFTQLEIEDITQDVFPGLAGYIDRLNEDPVMNAALDPAKLRQYRMFAKVLRWWSNGRLRFVLVKAMKGVKR